MKEKNLSTLDYIRSKYGVYLNSKDAAKIILSDEKAIRAAINSGELPNYGTERKIRIDAKDLVDMMELRKNAVIKRRKEALAAVL